MNLIYIFAESEAEATRLFIEYMYYLTSYDGFDNYDDYRLFDREPEEDEKQDFFDDGYELYIYDTNCIKAVNK